MSVQKSNTMQALWVAMGSFSAFTLSIMSAAILSRYFDKTEYGSYRQIIYIYSSLLVIFSAGLPRVFAYYLPRYDLDQGKDIVFKITKVLLITGFFFSISLFFGAGFIANVLNNPELEIGLRYFSPVPFFLLPTLGVEGIFSTYKKTIFIAIYNTLSRLLMLLFIVMPVVLFKGDYLYAIYGWVVVSVITFILALYFKTIPFQNVKSKPSLLSVKTIFSYSLPLLVASLGGMAIKAADQFYISRYFGAETFAEFANGFMELPFVSMITFSIASVLMPIFSKMDYEKSDSIEIITIWQSALMKSAMIIYPLVLFFIFYADAIMLILFSDSYHESAIYFRVALVANFFNVIMFAPLLLAMGKNKFYSNIHVVFAIIAWVGGYFTIIITNSPIGLAIFSVLKAILLTLVSFFYTSRLINVSFFKLFPVDKLIVLIIHSLMNLFIIKYCLEQWMPKSDNIFVLAILFCCFSILLVLTAKPFKIKYTEFLTPLIKGIQNYKKR